IIGQVACTILAINGYIFVLPMFAAQTLTLPGLAGIILAVGMGVDANVITAERIKEEVIAGRTIDGAIEAGYKKAWSSILDGNVTTFIVAFILFIMGSGTIKSFGFTLGVGVLLNFVMGVFASRQMLRGISKFKIFRKINLYGGAKNA
ncbi:MAG: MMPL family transporter, partial [Clostridia bacterium]|nr:MMPL family transporter [Clostridia bacterium]